MYFRDPNKELPITDGVYLVRHDTGIYIKCGFDVDKERFLQYDSEGIVPWRKEYVLGWMPISELDSIEIK